MSASATGFDGSNFRMLVRAAIVSKSPGSFVFPAAATFALASASSPLSEKIIIAIVPTTMTVTIVRIICIMNRFIVNFRLLAFVRQCSPSAALSCAGRPVSMVKS